MVVVTAIRLDMGQTVIIAEAPSHHARQCLVMEAKVIVPNLSRAGIKGNSIDGNAEERAAADTRVRRDGWLYWDLIRVRYWTNCVGVSTIWKLPGDMVWDAIALDGPNAIFNRDYDRILFTINRWLYGCG